MLVITLPNSRPDNAPLSEQEHSNLIIRNQAPNTSRLGFDSLSGSVTNLRALHRTLPFPVFFFRIIFIKSHPLPFNILQERKDLLGNLLLGIFLPEDIKNFSYLAFDSRVAVEMSIAGIQRCDLRCSRDLILGHVETETDAEIRDLSRKRCRCRFRRRGSWDSVVFLSRSSSSSSSSLGCSGCCLAYRFWLLLRELDLVHGHELVLDQPVDGFLGRVLLGVFLLGERYRVAEWLGAFS